MKVAIALLTASLTSYTAAIYIESYGHRNYHVDAANFDQIDDCTYTYQIKDNINTCDSVASYNSVSTKALLQLNTWLSCGSYIAQDTLVCVPSPPPVPTTSSDSPNSHNDVLSTLLPGNGSAVVSGSSAISASASSVTTTATITSTSA
ncbi:UNVERIFIED_CONTAM: hypothetical protein HDU68_003284, partial [Siphonaria sp. JEL0065]